MEQEVDRQVLAVINEKRLSGPPLTPVEIVARMGVSEARDKAFDAAWLAAGGGGVIAPIWAEHVHLGSNGRWFCLESLATAWRADGTERSAAQLQRVRNRIALLKQTFDAGATFRAVLQTNRVAIAELESNRSAKVSTRVRDDAEWHVATWDIDGQLAVLVRGPRDWTPDEAELRAAKERSPVAGGTAAAAVVAGADDVAPQDIHATAVAYAVKHFTGYGYKAEEVTGQDLGYDLEVTDAKGKTLLKLAIKGSPAGRTAFGVTRKELARSASEPLWRLLVVSDVLSPAPQHKIYKASDMAQAPGFDPAV